MNTIPRLDLFVKVWLDGVMETNNTPSRIVITNSVGDVTVDLPVGPSGIDLDTLANVRKVAATSDWFEVDHDQPSGGDTAHFRIRPGFRNR